MRWAAASVEWIALRRRVDGESTHHTAGTGFGAFRRTLPGISAVLDRDG
jgi:hypothetical protein